MRNVIVAILVLLAANALAQVAPLDSGRAAAAKAAINGLWKAAQIYYQDKGEWPESVGDLVQQRYVEIDSAKVRDWHFRFAGCHPEAIWAMSTDTMGRGECPECPRYTLIYDVLAGRWSGSGIPRYGIDTLSVQERAELSHDAQHAMRAVSDAAKVYYSDKGEWPKTVEPLQNEHYIGVFLSSKAMKGEPYANMVSPATFAQWQFGLIGEPAHTIVAISTTEMPGGAGHAIQYDVESGVWTGYGVVDAWLTPPSPVQIQEHQKQR